LVIHSLKVADPITLLSVKGNVDNVLAPTVNLSGSLRSDLAQLKSYAVMSLPETLKLGGIAEAAFQVQGPAAAPDTMDIAFTAASDTIEVNQYNARDIRVDGRFKAKKLTVSKLQATVYAGEFIADASIDLNKPDPDFTLNTALKNFNMQTFAADTGLIPPDYQGILSAGIKAHGSGITPEKLTAHAEITAEIENGKVKNIALDTVRCKAAADYKKAQLNGKLDLLYKTIQAVSTIMVDTILTEPYIDCTAATELDLADLSILPVDPKALGLDELKLSGKVSAQVKAAGPIRNWTTGTAKAELSSKKLGIKNIIFEQVAVNAGYGKNQLKAELQSNAYGGTITAHADADLKPDNFTYKASAAIKTVDIGKLIQESKIIPQQYEGILNADGTVSGTGKITPALQLPTDTLQGSGRLDLTDGYLSDSSLVKSIADLLGIELVVNEAHGTFNAHDGSVYTEDTKLLGPTANIGITGAVGFNQALDMTGRVTLTSEGAQSISSGIRDNVFVYENEEYYTEMKIGGTVSAPKPAYTDFIKNWLKKKAPEILLKQVIGGNDSSEQESSQSSPQEAIIKGLFKILTK
ncbi:MAG: AsmA-like C-terminal region-containing protein, partial [Candidatus Omnitrophica bacterium]|nr:AsmA-like C-terminal region-containing protein [Candidatus Omnitrophota bacterium]